MKAMVILGSGFVAAMLASGAVMANDEVEQLRSRNEVQQRINMQDDGEQNREQLRNRYEGDEGEQRKEQHRYQHQYRNGSRATTAGGRR